MNQDLLSLVDEFESSAAEDALQRALRHQGILSSEATLGGGKLSKRLREIPDDRLTPSAVQRALAETESNLLLVYRHANIRVYLAFSVSLLCAAATVGLGLWSVWYTLTSGAKVSQLKAVSSFLSAILSGSCFWLYRRERQGLDVIERELSRVDKFKKQALTAAQPA